MASTTLFPPIFDQSYMPSSVFVGTDSQTDDKTNMKIYFRLSPYNSLSQIGGVLASVRLQSNNISVARSKTQIVLKSKAQKHIHSVSSSPGLYYIIIGTGDVKFKTGIYYKIQLRFIEKTLASKIAEFYSKYPFTINNLYNPEYDKNFSNFLINNENKFSEWSSTVIAKKINKPIVTLQNFKEGSLIRLRESNIVISGNVEVPDEDERLSKYNIQFFNENDELIEDSGDIRINSYKKTGKVFYRSHSFFDVNSVYSMKFTYITNSQFTETFSYRFIIDEVIINRFQVNVRVQADNSAGRIKVRVYDLTQLANSNYNIVIRRSSSEDNFNSIKDVYKFSVSSMDFLDETWYDYTIKSGVWYKYYAAQEDSKGSRSNYVTHRDPIMPYFEDIFLMAQDQQLTIRFDPSISNFSYSISESTQQTLGSKYPFIRRNGNIKYRTFPLSGTISAFMDIKNNTFAASPKDLYKSNYDLYKNYNSDNNITMYNDSIYEREFREKVIDFLYKQNVKLFKSTTEGNLLTVLTNISFTPNATLNRHIYSFNCNVVEIADYTIQNILKYNIYTNEKIGFQDNRTFEVFGQLSRCPQNLNKTINSKNLPVLTKQGTIGYFSSATENILSLIPKKYKYLENQNFSIKLKKVHSLRIYIFGQPQFYNATNKNIVHEISEDTIQGYKISLTTENESENGLESKSINIIIPAYLYQNEFSTQTFYMGVYDLIDNDIAVTQLQIIGSKYYGMFIDYKAILRWIKKSSSLTSSYYTQSRKGQLYKNFSISDDNLYNKIFLKYQTIEVDAQNQNKATEQQRSNFQTINSLKVYAQPGTVISILEEQDGSVNEHIINSTGFLEFFNKDSYIINAYFSNKFYLDEVEDSNKKVFNFQIQQEDYFPTITSSSWVPVSSSALITKNYQYEVKTALISSSSGVIHTENYSFGQYIIDPLIKNFVDKKIFEYINNQPGIQINVNYTDFKNFLNLSNNTEFKNFLENIDTTENSNDPSQDEFFISLFYCLKNKNTGNRYFETKQQFINNYLKDFLISRIFLYLDQLNNNPKYFYFYKNKYYEIGYNTTTNKYNNIITIDNVDAMIEYECSVQSTQAETIVQENS